MDIQALLETAGLTRNLQDDFIDWVVNSCEKLTFEPGQKIISEVTRSRDMFIIDSGAVDVTFTLPFDQDRNEVITNLHVGQLFGELAFTDGCPRSATVKAATKCQVLVISYDKLMALMEKDHTFGFRFMSNLAAIIASKLRDTNLAYRNTLLW